MPQIALRLDTLTTMKAFHRYDRQKSIPTTHTAKTKILYLLSGRICLHRSANPIADRI